jgi:outer membrane protein assembly factor BamB
MARRLAIPLVVFACGRFGFPAGARDASGDAAVDLKLCGDMTGVPADAPWPMIHGCPTNAGRGRFVGPAGATTAFAPTGPSANRRGAVVAGGNNIFVQDTANGTIYAFDAAGNSSWTNATLLGAGTEGFAVIDDRGELVTTTNYGKIFVTDPASGATLWSMQFGGVFTAPVIAAPGTVYYGAVAPYGFYAVDIVARTLKWHYDVPNGGDAATAPAVDGGLVYFVDTKNSQLYALAADTGAQVFGVAVPGGALGSPVLGVGTVYVATQTAGIAAFDRGSGAALWPQSPSFAVVQPALLATGDVVSATTNGIAFVLDRATGAQRVAWMIGPSVVAPPTIDADDTIYFATDHGTAAYTVANGLAWQSQLAGPIVLADHGVVVLPPAQTVAMIWSIN